MAMKRNEREVFKAGFGRYSEGTGVQNGKCTYFAHSDDGHYINVSIPHHHISPHVHDISCAIVVILTKTERAEAAG
jgi:hypothetical protein